MRKLKKTHLWAVGVLGTLLLLLLAFLLLLPRLINLEPLREEIQASISQVVGGAVEFQRIDFSFFPRPGVLVHQGSLSIPGKLAFHVETLTIYPKVLPLLAGRVRIAMLKVEGPDVTLKLPKRSGNGSEHKAALSLAGVKEQLASALSVSEWKMAGLVVEVEKGELDLIEKNKSVFRFSDIHAYIDLTPNRLKFDVTCESNLWEGIALKGSLDAKDFKGEGHVDLTHFRPQILTGHLFPHADFRLSDSQLDLNIRYKTAGLKTFEAAIGGDVPVLTLYRGNQEIVLSGKNLKGALEVNGDKTTVALADLNLSANIESVPYPLEINGGHVLYDGTKIAVKDLSGKLKGSYFSQLSARLDWKKEPHIQVLSGKAGVSLNEVYAWVSSLEGLSGTLKDLKTVEGFFTISELSFKGPLLEPENWHFKTTGEVKGLAVTTTLFPGPVEIRTGNVDATEKKLSIKGAEIRMLDASLQASGVLDNYMGGLNRVDITFQGDLKSESMHWLSSYVDVPPEFTLGSALSISQAHVSWESDGETSLSGDLAVQNGPQISADIVFKPDELTISRLSIQDQESRASVKLKLNKNKLDLSFTGNLHKTTLDKVMTKNQILDGWIKGDFQSHVDMNYPVNSMVQGQIQGKGLVFPRKWKGFERINSFDLDCQKNMLKVASADITWSDSRLQLQGKVDFSAEGVKLDMDVIVNEFDWGNVEKTLEVTDKEKDDTQKNALSSLPVQGVLRVRTGRLKYGEVAWSPFHANVSFSNDRAEVTVTEADLCGISTLGVLKVTPQFLSLDIDAVSRNQEVGRTVSCLWSERADMTGSFDLNGKIMMQGKGEELAKSLEGNVQFLAKDGRIHRMLLLAKVFRFLNVTEVFRGQAPDLSKEGFGYKSIKIEGRMKDGKLMLDEVVIDGSSMHIATQGHIDLVNKKLDLTVLVSPLKTVDAIISKIPLVNIIMGGTLVSIPVKVVGDLTDPKVIPLSPSAVGSSLLGILKRTIKLPIDVIQPVLPSGQEKRVAPEE